MTGNFPGASIADIYDGWYGIPARYSLTYPKRSLIVGAGLSKSMDSDAPLFTDIRRTAEHTFAQELYGESGVDPSELFEAMLMVWNRRKVVETILSEPHHIWALNPPRFLGNSKRSATGAGFFRTLKEYTHLIKAHRWDIPLIDSRRGALLVGRLVVEGIVDQILSTNWDVGAELGCYLAGTYVVDEQDEQDLKPTISTHQRVRVYDNAHDVHKHPVKQNEPAIFKLHGGIRELYRLLSNTSGVSDAKIEKELKDGFLVSTSDLHLWHGRAKWVDGTVNATLRSSSCLFVGVSFADPCFYHAVRDRIESWCKSRPSTDTSFSERPPTFAIDYSAALKARNAMTIWAAGNPSSSVPANNLRKADAVLSLRQLLSLHYVDILLRAFRLSEEGQQPSHDAVEIKTFLGGVKNRIRVSSAEINWVGILLDCVVPSSRWAAIAECIYPFKPARALFFDPQLSNNWTFEKNDRTTTCSSGYHQSQASWWQAKWAHDCQTSNRCSSCKQLRQIGRTLCHLSRLESYTLKADRINESLCLEKISGNGNLPLTTRKFYLWPWAWGWKAGLNSHRLWHASQSIAGYRTPSPHLQSRGGSAIVIAADPDNSFRDQWQLDLPWCQRATKWVVFDGEKVKLLFCEDLFSPEAPFLVEMGLQF